MSNITFHRRHMTAVPTDLLLDPMISIEAKAFAGILQAIPTGNHDLQENRYTYRIVKGEKSGNLGQNQPLFHLVK